MPTDTQSLRPRGAPRARAAPGAPPATPALQDAANGPPAPPSPTPQLEPAYTAGHEDGRDVVLYYRDPQGRQRERRQRSDFAAYFQLDGFPRELRRDLETSRGAVRYVREEGAYLRVGFTDRWYRKRLCTAHDSPLVEAGLRPLEADVDPVRRHFSDTGDRTTCGRRGFFDLEVDSTKTFADQKAGRARVLAWAVSTTRPGVKRSMKPWALAHADAPHVDVRSGVLEWDDDDAERRLLEDFFLAVDDLDQLCPWCGDDRGERGRTPGYDFQVLFNRARALGVAVDARRWSWSDYLELYKRQNQNSAQSGAEKRSMKLESIAQAELGTGKNKLDGSKTRQAWDNAVDCGEDCGACRACLVRYCVQDADLIRRVDEKTGYGDLFATLCDVSRLFCETTSLQPTRQMDGFMLRLGVERGYHFPSKQYREWVERDEDEEEQQQYKGALVLTPDAHGIVRDVHIVDFAGMYPNIMLTFAMSPDTKVDGPASGPIPPGMCRAPGTGVCFSTEREGILVYALREMVRLRKHWRDLELAAIPGSPEAHYAGRMSMAYKVACNAMYGVVGSEFSRFHDREIAESTTQNGVWFLKLTVAEAKRWGFRVIYGDSDACWIVDATAERVTAFVKHCNEVVYPESVRRQGCVTNTTSIEYEKAYERAVLVTAKRYVASYSMRKGHIVTEVIKPEIKGLEYKRGDVTVLAARLQAEVIDLLVGGLKLTDHPRTEDLVHYHRAVARARDHVLDEPLPLDEVRLSKSLTKTIKEYEAKQKTKLDGTLAALPPHVVAAKQLVAQGMQLGEGQRVEYVVVDGAAAPMRVLSAAQYDGTNVDRYYVWETLVFPPTQRLLEAAFPDHDWKPWLSVRPKRPRVPVHRNQVSLFAPEHLKRVLPQPAGDPVCGSRK